MDISIQELVLLLQKILLFSFFIIVSYLSLKLFKIRFLNPIVEKLKYLPIAFSLFFLWVLPLLIFYLDNNVTISIFMIVILIIYTLCSSMLFLFVVIWLIYTFVRVFGGFYIFKSIFQTKNNKGDSISFLAYEKAGVKKNE